MPSQISSIAVQLDAVERSIKDNPLIALGFGALAGFVIGGGYRSRFGTSLILLAGRAALREVVNSAVSKAMDEHDGRSDQARD
jgi:uncharacterized membrane protein YebE (DUF533 family)